MSNTGLLKHIRSPPEAPPKILIPAKALLCIMPITQIAIGAVHLNDCPREQNIPIYLIVVGVFGLVLALLACLPCAQGTANLVCKTWNSLVAFFLFCWFIAGNVWVYSIYKPSFSKNTTHMEPYCEKTLYLFAFWNITVVYILLLLLVFGSCCVLFCFYLCGRADPDDAI